MSGLLVETDGRCDEQLDTPKAHLPLLAKQIEQHSGFIHTRHTRQATHVLVGKVPEGSAEWKQASAVMMWGAVEEEEEEVEEAAVENEEEQQQQ